MKIKFFFTLYLISTFSSFLVAQSEEYPVRDISFNFFENRKLELENIKDSFDVKKALKLLFPGKYYEEVEEHSQNIYENAFVAWSCKKCPRKKFELGDDIIGDFPFKYNYTRIIGIKKYRQGDTNYMLVGLSTFDNEPAMGRYSYGILGLATFKKNINNQWELNNFSPNICGQGSFGRAHFPSNTTQLSNTFTVFTLTGGNANPGGADEIIHGINNFRVYAEINNKIQEVIQISEGKCYTMYSNNKKFGSNWDSKVVAQSNSNTTYPNIEILTSGTYDKTVDELYTPIIKELERYLSSNKKFKFEWRRVYEFNNSRYELIENKIKIISK